MKTAPRTHLRDAVALALGASLIAGAFSATRAYAQAPAPAPAPAPSSPTPNTAPVTPPPTSTAPGAPAASTAPTPGAPRPFKDIIKDAKETKGFFTLWQKDDKVWIEVKPEQLDKPFLLAMVNTGGLGEQRIYGGLMDDNGIAYFKKVGNQMQLLLANERFRAPKGSPTERAIKTSFSESLIGSGAVLSAPHPDTKAVLIEANSLLLVDMAGAATTLENAFRIPYALDGRNSSLVKASTHDDNTGFDVSLHFAVPKLPARPLVPNPAVPVVPPPANVPDARSLFLGYRVNFAKLPEKPMAPRLADERVGYFTTTYVDFADDLRPNPNVHLVRRWRLEKKDPAAAMSEPVKPIVYWLDKNIPVKHRKAVIDGVLEWNKAFERIGFKDAIQAKVQPDDATFDTTDTTYATVRWYLASGGAPAIGPSLADPRTGEIIDADILMTDVFTRSSRRFVSEDAPKSNAHEHGMPGFLGSSQQFCNFAEQAHGEADFAMDILEARGDIAPDSPEAEKFVYEYVKEVITHEVGHTLGLRHNFRSSTIFTAAQIADPEFTAKNGVIGSVMDYPPFNIPTKGQKAANYVQPSLGPYDYWAIEFAYKPIDPANEKAELEAIAARGAKDPLLAYGTDEDSFIGGSPQGMDPTVNVWDLTDNPLGYYRKRLELSRELWDRIQSKQLADGESYDTLRRSFLAGFDQMNRGLLPVTKYVGGIVQVRDRAGSGRLPFTPVPAAQQREALKILNDGLFSVDSFTFKPEFLASLPHNRQDYFDAMVRGDVNRQPMVSVSGTVLKLQREVLDQVMSDVVATRLMESQSITKKGEAFKLSELYDNLQGSIWSELKSGREVTPMRRNLQREHLRRVAVAITRSSAGQPADARALQRMNAQQLAADLRGAQGKAGLSKETRAHYAESLNTIDEALKAPIQRAGA